jgi:hypothetical protein
MGKHDVSVAWAEVAAAIAANPQRGVTLGLGDKKSAASASIAAMPSSALAWLGDAGWTEDTSCTISDVVSFVLWVRDPLYRVAATAVRRAMEMEEAAWLLENSETLWKTHGGKARGWVRKHLEEDLRARSGGADAPPDTWETVRTTRRAALLVDYVCVVRGVRIALWWPEHSAVTMIPAAGGVGAAVPVVQLSATAARILLGPRGFQMPAAEWPAFVAAKKSVTWTPPASSPAAGTNTVAQIHEALDELLGPSAAPRTGNRTALWNRLQWERMVCAVTGTEQKETIRLAPDAPAPSE